MLKSDEFFTFDEVIKELKITEDELKKMVSEGEIRAFKDEDKMKFKKADIDAKKSDHITEPTVILPPGEVEFPPASEEGVFIEEDTTSNIGATEEMSIGSDTDIHIPGLLEESEVTTPVEPAQDAGATVEEEISSAETIAEDEAVEAIPEELMETVAERTKGIKPKKKLSRFISQPTAKEPVSMAAAPFAPAYIPKFKTPAVFIILLGVSLLFLFLIGSFLSDSLRISSNRGKLPVGFTSELGQVFVDIFGLKDINKPINLKQLQEESK